VWLQPVHISSSSPLEGAYIQVELIEIVW